jgi:Protein of unknown function (DUF3024)
MALSELELKRCEHDVKRFVEHRRPPAHIRPELDFGYRIEGQSVEIFEIRPDWRDRSIKRETPVAKATYVRSSNRWKVYWLRSDLKWHRYEPSGEVRSLAQVLAVVDRDEFGCFFG